MQMDNIDQFDGGDVKAGRWTAEEHTLFLQGLQLYSKQWKQIAELVKTRTVVQIRTHAQKYFQKLDKMKDGKAMKSSTVHDSKDDTRKSSSRSSSITSDFVSDGIDTDTELEEFSFGPGIESNEMGTPRKRARQSGAPKQRKRANLGVSSIADAQLALMTFPTDEGSALDQSIVTLLEKIDWSGPYSRCHSPFMDSAASVCSSLDTLQESFPFFDFGGYATEMSTPRAYHNPNIPVLGKERLAFSNVVREMKEVFSSYKIGSYDRLPSIKTLLSMTSSNLTVSCTKNLTPSHTTFCHYQICDSPNLFGDDHDFQPIGMAVEPVIFSTSDAMDDEDLLSPTPRKRGRPRKNSISST